MEVHYFVKADDEGNIGDAIPQAPEQETRQNQAPTIKNHLKTRRIEVRKCKTTEVDETLHTVDEFLVERETSNMPWSEAIYNFSHCLGHTARMRFQKVKNSGTYDNTEDGFKSLIKDYIKELCLDKNAKGTLKQSIEKGEWIKPEDVEIANHNIRVLQLFGWIDQVPGYQEGDLSDQEKHRLYVLTFPPFWGTNFNMQKNINDTSFEEIDDYMRKQKDSADKKKKQKKKDEKKDDKKPHKKGKGNGKDKYKLDPNATTGPTARCGKCPNAKHSWGHCFLNPRNPKNKLKDAEFMSRHASNRNRNQGNNQFQNNQQPRQGFATQQMQPPPPPPPNYQGVYSTQSQNQGPPSSVSIQSGQSLSNSNDQGGRWSTVWIPN